LMLVAAPQGGNPRGIPNEDSRSFDLDDTNLFAINRFPGLDRSEGGVRLTYGGQWTYARGPLNVEVMGGQSFRLDAQQTIFPAGTGLQGKFSDLVGRTTVSWGRSLDLVHRFRVDKKNLGVRRNEIDAIWRSGRVDLTAGYSNLNRNITTGVEDLQDQEEIRLGARFRITPYWSLVGYTIQDLTDGRAPIRDQLSLEYEDECFAFGVTYRRNFTSDRDFRKGTTFILRFRLKGLGS
jgi:LPS-assembly protein